MDLIGKRVLITGAGQGLGKALAFAFAQAGSEIIVTDITEAGVKETVKSLEHPNRRVAGYVVDVTCSEQVNAVRNRIHAELGPIDLLINNAGIVYGGEFSNVPLDRHEKTVSVNLDGVLTVTHAFLADLVSRPEAHLVNIASAAAVVPLPWAVSYAASKAAVLAFSDSLREELRLLGHRHVGVTTVCPSYIGTGLFAGAKAPRFTSLLDADGVAAAVVRAVRKNRALVMLPWPAHWFYSVCGCLPGPVYRRLCAWLGISTSMVEWKGRGS
ncbi:MAG: SDR family NAD(P)-dependent oxidoreductase [Gemmataceae bacterium]